MKDPKVYKLGIGMTLGYPRSGIVLGLKVKAKGERVNKCILH